jgi:two-component system response regulator NreC
VGQEVRVAIASEYRLARCGLRYMLDSAPAIKVVAEASTNAELTEACRNASPTVVVEDAGAGEPTHFRAMTRISKFPQIPILMISAVENHSLVRGLLAAGLAGYLLKHAAEEELVEAVRSLHQGQRYIDARLRDKLLDTVLGGGSFRRKKASVLSRREIQLLHNITRGFTNAEIAAHLRLGVRTVETYRARMYKKLGLSSRAELVSYATATGLIAKE